MAWMILHFNGDPSIANLEFDGMYGMMTLQRNELILDDDQSSFTAFYAASLIIYKAVHAIG